MMNKLNIPLVQQKIKDFYDRMISVGSAVYHRDHSRGALGEDSEPDFLAYPVSLPRGLSVARTI